MIVTTAIKAEAVRSLSDFMNVKGKFMQYRLDPTYAARHPTFYEDILAFIEKHTDIPERPFWFEMDMQVSYRHKEASSLPGWGTVGTEFFLYLDEVNLIFSLSGWGMIVHRIAHCDALVLLYHPILAFLDVVGA